MKHEFQTYEEILSTPFFACTPLIKTASLGSIIQVKLNTKESVKEDKLARRLAIKGLKQENPDYEAPKHLYKTVFTVNYSFLSQKLTINFDTFVRSGESLEEKEILAKSS